MAELEEELGILSDEIARLGALCLVQHPTGVLDMGIHIETTLDAPEILARHQAAGNAEYDQLLILPPRSIPAAIAARGGTMVPSTPRFLAAAERPAP